MQKNVCNQASYASFMRNNGYRHWNSSLNWLLASAGLNKLNDYEFERGKASSHNTLISEKTLQKYKVAADMGIAQIQDPLWQRVCVDVLKILGPIAFKDFWKINFLNVSLEGRRAHLACPSRSTAEAIEKYHFVIIAALKKFYPSLFSIETEVR